MTGSSSKDCELRKRSGGGTSVNAATRVAELECEIRLQNNVVTPYKLIPGKTPVLVSAPHALPHPRDGRKPADLCTGAIARILGETTSASVIYLAKEMVIDPNYDKADCYKDQIAKLIRSRSVRFVIDIHGMADDSTEADIEIGTGTACGQTGLGPVLDEMVCALQPFKVVVDQKFTAQGCNTVTSFSRKYGAFAVQLELARSVRQPNRLECLLGALCRVVKVAQTALTRAGDATTN